MSQRKRASERAGRASRLFLPAQFRLKKVRGGILVSPQLCRCRRRGQTPPLQSFFAPLVHAEEDGAAGRDPDHARDDAGKEGAEAFFEVDLAEDDAEG